MSKDNFKALPPIALPDLEQWKSKLEENRRQRREDLIKALREERGVVLRAARRLDLPRQWVVVLIREFGLQGFVDEQRKKRRKLEK